MKRGTVLFLLFLCLFCACQPTPEQDAVKQKDTNQLISAVQEAEQEKSGPVLTPVKEFMPQRFQCDFVTDIRQVRVTADVPIRVLTEGVFPLLRVQRREVTSEERLTIYKRLFGSDGVYKYEYVPTKEAIVREIEYLLQEPTEEEKKEYLEDPEESEETWAAYLQSRKDRIEVLRQKYLAMPDDGSSLPFEPWDGSVFTVGTEGNPGMIVGVEYPVSGRMVSYGTLLPDRPVDYSRQQDERTGTYSVYSFDKRLDMPGVERIAPEAYDRVHDGAAITARAAAETALAPLDGLGNFAVADILWSHDADDEAVSAGITGKQAYLVRLTPMFHGASLLYTGASAMDIPEGGGYTPIWHYEHVLAAVDGDGTILGMAWESPLTETEVLADSTTLLPFEEIMGIFARQVDRIYSYEEATGAALTVTDVRLGLFRIREQGDLDSGLLVPAWFITGEYRSAKHPEDVSLLDEYWPIAVINAVNGSLIDVRNGY